jgi:hypothetical protein
MFSTGCDTHLLMAVGSVPQDIRSHGKVGSCATSQNVYGLGPPLWSSSQSSWLLTQKPRVPFPALPDFLSSSGSGTGSTQPREDK